MSTDHFWWWIVGETGVGDVLTPLLKPKCICIGSQCIAVKLQQGLRAGKFAFAYCEPTVLMSFGQVVSLCTAFLIA